MIFPGEAEPSIGRHLLAGGEAVVYSCRSPDKATLNEDAAAVIPLGGASGVLVVADGMGGAPAGREAAQRVVNHVVDALREPVSDAERLRTKILDGIERANEAVRELGMGAGATLVVAEICEGIVRPYHAGDAAVMLVGLEGKLKCLTVPHSPVGFAVAAGFLDEDEAIHHEQRHLITNLVAPATCGSRWARRCAWPPATASFWPATGCSTTSAWPKSWSACARARSRRCGRHCPAMRCAG